MKCEQLLRMINDYVDGDIDPSICDGFEEHLAGCNPCNVVVDNIRKTVTLYKGQNVYEIPIAFRKRLHDALRQKWQSMADQSASS